MTNDTKTVLKSYTAPKGFLVPMNIFLSGPINDRRIQAVINMGVDEFFLSPACVLSGMSWDTSSTVLSDDELILLIEESITETLEKFMPKNGKGMGRSAEEQIAEYKALKAEREEMAKKLRSPQGDTPGRFDSVEAFDDYMREVVGPIAPPAQKPDATDEDVAWEVRDMELGKPFLIVDMADCAYGLLEFLAFGKLKDGNDPVPEVLMVDVEDYLQSGAFDDDNAATWRKHLEPHFLSAREMGAVYIRFRI